MYVGQYLPSWRPEVDYRVSYSAKKEEGGGVLRDLSHELDLLNFLFGEWRELIACTGKKSSLEINSEDSINVLGVMKNEASFQISMNYTDRIAQRFIIVVTDSETFHIDLVKNTFKSSVRNENVIITRDISYIKMHQGICENSEYLCDFNAGLQVESLIEKVEESMKEKRWVKNGFV
jgi:predicted dehydrogenase